jgi:acetyl esterase/lipase
MGLIAVLSAASSADAAGPAKRFKVQASCDITYYDVHNDADAGRHRLDVYCPKAKGRYPVLFFLHGGAWVTGSKDDVFGLYGYGTIARCLAERGLVVVLPNYRLSPGVRHPEHIKDVARAFAWACKNVRKYGGDPRQIFVGGHSAGGHLAALLATDDTYLKRVGRSRQDIRGVICVSGIYRVDDLELKLSFADPLGYLKGDLDVRPFAVAFGSDPKVARQASPLTHVRRGLPPFLVLSAGFDYPPLKPMAREFAAALKKNGCDVRKQEVPWRTHETLLFDIPHFSVDPAAADAILDFIDRHTPRPAPKTTGKGPR